MEDSKKLTEATQACVIISASGTADAGRVRHHINSCINKKNCAILLVGYCGAGSLGGQLLKGVKEVEIFNDAMEVKAEIGKLQGMSAHADCDDLVRFLSCQDAEKVKTLFLVHGEYGVQQAFISRLEAKGFKTIEIPSQHQKYELGDESLKEKRA